jgi:hypothetical protein
MSVCAVAAMSGSEAESRGVGAGIGLKIPGLIQMIQNGPVPGWSGQRPVVG